jgi:membrane fusion protein
MLESNSLFRPAALAARRTRSIGDIVLVAPAAFGALACAAAFAAAAVIAFGVLASYTEHRTLRGQLVPDLGVIKVYAPQPGTVLERHVAEGQTVERGQVLYVISSERRSSVLGATYAQIGTQLAAQKESLAAQMRNTRALERAERESLERRMRALRSERGELDAMLDDQLRGVALAEQEAARYAAIRAQGFVAEGELVARQQALLEQRSRLGGLRRERDAADRELADLGNRLSVLPLEYGNKIAELERSTAAIEQELTRNEAQRRVSIAAPARGIATGVAGAVGEAAGVDRPLVVIVPAGAKLEARLYAPSRAIGFVGVGDEVLLRYAAYPYQKFGRYGGTVEAVSQAALAPAELAVGAASALPALSAEAREPVYALTVALDAQTVSVYGAPRPLRAGLEVEADVPLETRRLYEWALEPLLARFGPGR